MFSIKRSVGTGLIFLALMGITGCKKHYLEGFQDGEYKGHTAVMVMVSKMVMILDLMMDTTLVGTMATTLVTSMELMASQV